MSLEFVSGLFIGMSVCIAFACGCLVVREILLWKRLADAVDSYAKSAKNCADYVCGKLDEEISDMKVQGSRPNAKKAHGGWKRQKRHANGRFGGKE